MSIKPSYNMSGKGKSKGKFALIEDTKQQPNHDSTVSLDDIFKATELYFKQPKIMFSHHLNSFDKFLDHDVISLLTKEESIFYEKRQGDNIYTYKFEYSDIAIKPPMIDHEDELMTPTASRIRSLTYASKLMATVTQIQEITKISTGEKKRKIIGTPEQNYLITYIPIMVKSKYCTTNIDKTSSKEECKYDPGGYFIIRGNEKILITLEQVCNNRIFAYSKKESNSTTYNVQVNSKSNKIADMVQTVTLRMKKDMVVNLRVPIIHEIPVFIVLRALGLETDKDIIDLIITKDDDKDMLNLLRILFENSQPDDSKTPILSSKDARDYMTRKIRVNRKYTETDEELKKAEKLFHLDSLLTNNFIPHLEHNKLKKAYYLCMMLNRLLNCYLGRIPFDDRDSFSMKRLDVSGKIMFELFKQHYKKMLNDCNKFFVKHNKDDNSPLNIINQIKPNIIEQGIKTTLMMGTWNKLVGVAQMFDRVTYIWAMTKLRHIKTTSIDASTNKSTAPRHLHGSQIGFLCYVETPEGANVGLVKNLSIMGNITVMSESQYYILYNLLKRKTQDILSVGIRKLRGCRVFLNGNWIGVTDKHIELYRELKNKKINGDIDINTSIVFTFNYNVGLKELHVLCDSGRLFRPIMRVENNKLLLTKKQVDSILLDDDSPSNENSVKTWNEFMLKYKGVIEYIDVDEAINSMIAISNNKVIEMFDRKIESIKNIQKIQGDIDSRNVLNRYDNNTFVMYDFCEFHPSMHYGLVSSTTPFCNHNMTPRNMYQYSQAKQALGIYSTNYRNRMDQGFILYHPQRPIANTRASKFTNTGDLPFGENAIVAIMCYTGHNQEDSIIVNQSAIDRGLYRATQFYKNTSVIGKNQSTSKDDIFMKPDRRMVVGAKSDSYSKLNEEGYAPEETVVENGDVVIGKVSPIPPVGDSGITLKDSSEYYKSHAKGKVDRVWKDIYDSEGYGMIKMRIRSERTPIIGDKFCCYDDSHDVLTDKGWIKINELNMEHKVASLNNGVMSYEPIQELQSYDFDGKMYVVESKQVSLRVTPNHRMYIGNRLGQKFTVKTAEEIYGERKTYKKTVDDVIPMSIGDFKELEVDDKGEIINFLIFDENDKVVHRFNIDDWLVIVGVWLAEGAMSKTRIDISVNKQRVRDAIEKACENLGIRLGKYQDKKSDELKNRYSICSKYIGMAFQKFHEIAINKYVPDWAWCLKPKHARILMDSMILGDGNYMDGTCTIRYYTSSTRLRDDFQRLAIHSRVAANYYLKSEKGSSSYMKNVNGEKLEEPRLIVCSADAWRLTLVTKQGTPLVNKNFIKKNNTGQLDRWEDFKGKVYCCSVGGEGIIYVRREGKPVWCGNSRSGQKGCIGTTLNSSDMPFTKDGIQPDIIMNPCAIPTRMTMGQIIECVVSKSAVLQGKEVDATPFMEIDEEKIGVELEKYGYKSDGTEYLYNGMTGKKIKVMIFIGPTYYLRLKHLVFNKIHSRARGPRTVLTRLPLEGRARDGGLRAGEMERDAMIGHGMSRFLKERFMETADSYVCHVCDECGLFASRVLRRIPDGKMSASDINEVYKCPSCKNSTNISKVAIPYCFKLLVQEMMSLNIAPRITTVRSKFDV